ncbi:MAG: hypothetical protein KA419_09190 [Acidobacteria bacterium]|nr:hypothetical protein [Acidobacteriota bacterium]
MDCAVLLIRLFEEETLFTLVREDDLAFRRSFPGPPPFDPPGVPTGRRQERVPLGAFLRGLPAAERPAACLVALCSDLPPGFDDAAPSAERQVLSHVLDSGGRVADLYHHDRNRPFPGLQLEALRQLPGALVAPAPHFTLAAGLTRAREAGLPGGVPLAWVHVGPHRTTVFCLRERPPRADGGRSAPPPPGDAGAPGPCPGAVTPAPPRGRDTGSVPPVACGAAPSPGGPVSRPALTGFRLTAVFSHRTALLNPRKLEDYILRTVAGAPLDEEIRLDGGIFAEIRSEAGIDERPEILLHDPAGAFHEMPGVVRVAQRGGLDLEDEGMLAALPAFRLPLLRL